MSAAKRERQRMREAARAPVQKQMCKSCPFSNNPEALREFRVPVAMSALTEAARECHSTGQGAKDILGAKKWIETKLCRGARDLQLKYFAAIGFLDEPTDAAWEKKCREMGIR